ncbi:MAG TPA: hypothetical protein VMG37_11890 [Solirubrobacteraceae bacterium]|nr:hypothetical protein [Solirubrobacteraceae bacterium]
MLTVMAEDLDALVVHLRYPLRHRERWRSTNWRESEGELSELLRLVGELELHPVASEARHVVKVPALGAA